MTMGEKILNMRKARNWSQEELAERAGVSRQAVSRWESGTARPDAEKIVILCDLFGVSADYLLRDDYSGEKNAETEVVHKPEPAAIIRRKVLQIYATLSAVCLCALKFISSVSPREYVRERVPLGDGIIGTQYAKGLLGFVMYYNLEWFLVLLLFGIAVGLVLIWQGSPGVRKHILALWNRIKAWRGEWDK